MVKNNYTLVITIGIFLTVQTCASIWWASSLTTSVQYLQQEVIGLKVAVKEHTETQNVSTVESLNKIVANTTTIIALKDRISQVETRLCEFERKLNAK